MDSFAGVRGDEERQYGEFRSKGRILEIYDDMADALAQNWEYALPLDPPPASPVVMHPMASREEFEEKMPWILENLDAAQLTKPTVTAPKEAPMKASTAALEKKPPAPVIDISKPVIPTPAPTVKSSVPTAAVKTVPSKTEPTTVKAGTAVTHKTFGKGKVVNIRNGLITVSFGRETKKFGYPEVIQKRFLVID